MWLTTAQDSRYDWEETGLGFLDIQDANALEPTTDLIYRFASLEMLNTLALLKINLLLDLLSLKNSANMLPLQVIPCEIFDTIRSHIPQSPIISKNRTLLERDGHTTETRELEHQIRQIYAHIQKNSPHFWCILLHTRSLLEKEERPDTCPLGSAEEAQMLFGYSYDAWVETPGAFAVIKALCEGDDTYDT